MGTAKQRHWTPDELVGILKQYAQERGRTWVSLSEFVRETGVPLKRILEHFGRWNAFVQAAGLEPLGRKGRPDAEKGYARDELLTALREYARKQEKVVIGQKEFCGATGISYRPIHRVFGNWKAFVSAAGLHPHPMQMTRIPDEELLDEYLGVYQSLSGKHPPYNEFAKRAKFSIGVYERRFGGFKGFRRRAVQRGINLGILQPSILPEAAEETSSSACGVGPTHPRLDDRPELGEEIDVPSLVHAPVNEMGVVYLFGAMAEQLGFRVESFSPTGFPDCEAKRRLTKGRWQRVRIEFEFRSSNFLAHKHDASKCDLIVCWVHDWRNSPIQVCCLKDIVSKKKP